MQTRSFIACLLSVLFLAGLSRESVAAQDLSLTPSPWYAVVHTVLGDELIWINGSGVQAALSRPKLPDEKEGPEAAHDVRISPNGRYAVITALLNNGQYGLGIYDFEAGAYVKTHTAQTDEFIVLGSRHSFMPDSTNIAVGFYTLTNNSVTNWRIIQFNLATGDAKGLLQKSDSSTAQMVGREGAYPYVIFSPGVKQLYSYYFTMIPYGQTDSSPYEVTGWAPNGNLIIPLGQIGADFDVLPNTTHFIEAGTDAQLPAAQMEGVVPIRNIITDRPSIDADSKTLLHDANAFLSSPRWASNGLWLAYHAATTNGPSWVVRTLAGDTSYTYNSLVPTEFYGTSDGYLLNYEGKTFSASTQIDGSASPALYETPQGDEARIIYVTPQDETFTLPSIKGASSTPATPVPPTATNVVPTATNVIVPTATDPVPTATNVVMPTVSDLPAPTTIPQQPTVTACENAPASRVAVGMAVRVAANGGTALQVRIEPSINGALITELAEETQFVLAEGPVCADGFTWWRLSLAIPGGLLKGWVAENSGETYLIEPF